MIVLQEAFFQIPCSLVEIDDKLLYGDQFEEGQVVFIKRLSAVFMMSLLRRQLRGLKTERLEIPLTRAPSKDHR